MRKYIVILIAIFGILIMPRLSLAWTGTITTSTATSTPGGVNFKYTISGCSNDCTIASAYNADGTDYYGGGGTDWQNPNTWTTYYSTSTPYIDVVIWDTPFPSGYYFSCGPTNHYGNGYPLTFSQCLATGGMSASTYTIIQLNMAPPAPTIAFNFPVNATSTGDFTNWSLAYSNTTSTDQYSAKVIYGLGQIPYTDSQTFTSSTSGNISITKENQLLTPGATTTWTAQAELLDNTEGDAIVATSSQITFNVIAPSLAFIFPTYGTTTGLFDNYIIEVQGLDLSTNLYQTVVTWTACPLGQPATNPNCTVPLTNNSAAYTGTANAYGDTTVNRTDWGFDFANNVTIYATASVRTVPIFGYYDTIASTSIVYTFGTIPNTSPSSTWSEGGIFTNVSSTGVGTYSTATTTGNSAILSLYNSTNCVAPAGITDVGGGVNWGLCEFSNVFFAPDPSGEAHLEQNIAVVEGDFPFSMIFAFINTASSSISEGTSGPVAFSSLAISLPASMGQATQTINLIPDAFAANSASEAVKNQIWPLVVDFMWLCTAFGIIYIIVTP